VRRYAVGLLVVLLAPVLALGDHLKIVGGKTLTDVTPSFATHYKTDSGPRNTIKVSKLLLCYSFRLVLVTYPPDIGFTQFRHRVLLAIIVPPFGFHISNVIGLTPEEQMVRVDTRWVVTSMKDQIPIRDRAIDEFVCDSVGTNKSSTAPPRLNLPVTVVVGLTDPQYTAGVDGLAYVLSKSNCNRLSSSVSVTSVGAVESRSGLQA
jgi:hypothetical protein